MNELLPIPELMKGRPLFHGLPIPFTTFIGADGLPDFKVTDEKLRRKCMTKSLCALCGHPLPDKLFVLIGGPKCVQSRIFYDPAMHTQCALYATKVCPYLANADWGYAEQPPRHLQEKQTVIITHEEVDNRRPDRIAVYYCRSYTMVRQRGTWFVKAGKPFKIDWNACARK